MSVSKSSERMAARWAWSKDAVWLEYVREALCDWRWPTQDELVIATMLGADGVLRRRCGRPIGALNSHGYVRVMLVRRSVKVHQLAYIRTHGPIPEGMHIDHINRDRTDNRGCNLRAVTPEENEANVSGPELRCDAYGFEVSRFRWGKFETRRFVDYDEANRLWEHWKNQTVRQSELRQQYPYAFDRKLQAPDDPALGARRVRWPKS